MKVTIKEVAKLAKVSPSTVSRVIADSPKISDATKKNVWAAMEELNYHPNVVARNLANKSTKTLGLILPAMAQDLTVNPFFINVMNGVSQYAQKKGYYIMYTNSTNEEEEVDFIKHFLNGSLVDGVILTTVRKDDKCIEYLKKVKEPFVVIGKPEEAEDVLWVDNDNFQAMYNVVNHIIRQGCKKIAFIGGSKNYTVTRYRLNGYKKALEYRGIQASEELIREAEYVEDEGYQAMKSILDNEVPDAVVTTDDLIAFGVLKAIKETGHGDILVSGFNNTPLAAYQEPKLTSVDINARELGYYAAKLLIDKLENTEGYLQNFIVDTELIKRESTERHDV